MWPGLVDAVMNDFCGEIKGNSEEEFQQQKKWRREKTDILRMLSRESSSFF